MRRAGTVICLGVEQEGVLNTCLCTLGCLLKKWVRLSPSMLRQHPCPPCQKKDTILPAGVAVDAVLLPSAMGKGVRLGSAWHRFW